MNTKVTSSPVIFLPIINKAINLSIPGIVIICPLVSRNQQNCEDPLLIGVFVLMLLTASQLQADSGDLQIQGAVAVVLPTETLRAFEVEDIEWGWLWKDNVCILQ